MQIGLSPAFLYAYYKENIDYEGLLDCIRKAHKLGFDSLQLEIFLKEHINNYMGNKAKEIGKLYKDLGLKNTVFCAHALREELFSFDKNDEKNFFEDFKEVLNICLEMDVINIINIPSYLPKQIFNNKENPYPGADLPGNIQFNKIYSFEKLWEMVVIRFNKILDIINDTKLYLTIEPIALTTISSSDSFLRLCDNLNNCLKLGLNLDVGHIFVQKEPLDTYIKKVNKKILSTHISDNDGIVPDHLPPGEGKIDWCLVISALKEVGFKGSLDIEINYVKDGNVDEVYLNSKNFLLKYL